MDLGLLYSNFAMDNRDLTLLTSPDGSAVFQDTDGQTYCTIRPYNHADPDLARDPFSSNRRFFDSGEIELYGTMVVAGPTTDIIYVLVPDHTTCTADDIEPADLQHVIGIRLGSPENLGANLPREDLHLSLCEGSLRPTLIADRRVYWAEITPLLQRWQSVNNTPCPHCHRLIRVNMSRHMRANHTDNQCYWRCPVCTCHMWFVSELNGKDHLERIHGFREGQGCSFYECLRRFGLEWFGERSYFDQRGQSSQAMWMDMALAHQSGQELINHYVITNSPASAPIRHFFHASIKHLTARYQHIAAEQALQDIKPSIGDQLNHNSGAVDSIKKEIDPPVNEASGYTATASDGDVFSPVVVTPRRSSTRLQSRESPVVGLPRRSSTVDMSVDSPVVDTPRRSYNQHNRALAVMEASAMEPPINQSINLFQLASLYIVILNNYYDYTYMTQTGVVPKIINICLVVQHININIQTHTCMTTFPHHTIPAHDRRIYTTYSSNMDQKRGERELYDKLPRLSISFDIVCFNLMIE